MMFLVLLDTSQSEHTKKKKKKQQKQKKYTSHWSVQTPSSQLYCFCMLSSYAAWEKRKKQKKLDYAGGVSMARQ